MQSLTKAARAAPRALEKDFAEREDAVEAEDGEGGHLKPWYFEDDRES